ncbi:MAG: aspartate--tRNA(Asn) ligase [Candidatus Micrarchaeota archaeon]|nr:aspartate--tRNA(Asn) ligase [Candidatus Micrarchaeota archaeon]
MKLKRTDYIVDIGKKENKEVVIVGWINELRDIGKIRFVQIRDKTGIAQVVAKKETSPKEVFEKIDNPKETVVAIKGIVRKSTIAKSGYEIEPLEIEILNSLSAKVPFELTGKVPAELDTRLDYRYVDIRRHNVYAIFKIKSRIINAFRQFLLNKGFDEIQPPVLVAAATEGGAELFEVKYFEKEAYLAQSPQLYKQLAVIGGMDKVFITMPVFRAEKHNTLEHLNEIIQMDCEIGFCDEKEAIELLKETFKHIVKEVKNNCKKELDLLGTELKTVEEIPSYSYSQLVEKLQEHDAKIEWGQDFDREHEKKLNQILKKEAYVITKWPTKIRAFYSMPEEENPEICKAYDLVYKGLEISSGAQRIHQPELLIGQLKKRGQNPENFKFYIDAFRVGAPPHAGWSIGLERITMKICDLKNIREAALFPRGRNRRTP